jgi:flagellar P-ring protein precursor FlgI
MQGSNRTTRTTARTLWLALAALAVLTAGALPAPRGAYAARIKDIASFSGLRTNQLVGYGLVVGLSGTGDKSGSAAFTVRTLVNMLEKMGVKVDPKTLKPANVAAVMVTSQMSVTARPGSKIDVTVSSMGDSTSLYGGVLMLTPLKGVDGNVYALGQGSLTVGGYAVSGQATQASKNVSTVAIIPGGANVERAVPFEFNDQAGVTLNMFNPDFSTTMAVVKKINTAMGGKFATAADASTIKLDVPPQSKGNLVPLMAALENLEVSPDAKAKVVVDEKTGTVVVGLKTQLMRAAITQGNLQIVVQETPQVSQPLPFSQGQTVVTPQTNVSTTEENRKLVMVEGATLQELIEGLNALGATPRDLISILRTLRASGALQAELEVI